MIRFWKLLFFFVCLACSSTASELSLSQSLDKASIAFDETATLEITLSWQGDQSAYRFDKPLQPQLDRLKVKQFSSSVKTSTAEAGEITTKTFRFNLEPTISGAGKIEPIVIRYVSWPDSISGELVTEGMILIVSDPVARPTSVPRTPTLLSRPVKIILGITLLLSMTFVAVLVIRSRRPNEVIQTPTQKLLVRLSALREESGGDMKQFQTGLYKLLLWYLSTNHGMNSTPRPTEDIVRFIDTSDMPPAYKEKIGAWLLQAQRQKFSPVAPAPGDVIRLEAEVRSLFETTAH
ncbi:MAG: hypothetical protein SGI97_02625 [candidate division Zixibacteria bacterium]|nr:hypothetical protein [candidate division Zixibacteria bacterium]